MMFQNTAKLSLPRDYLPGVVWSGYAPSAYVTPSGPRWYRPLVLFWQLYFDGRVPPRHRCSRQRCVL